MNVQFQFDFEKALAAVLYMAGREEKDVPALDVYKLCKLLFLADKYHLVKYARPITGDTYSAMRYGPIPSKTYDLLKAFARGDLDNALVKRLSEAIELDHRYQHPRLKAKVAYATEVLSKSDLMALDHIIELFGTKTFAELRALTHEMPAYRKAWDEKPDHKNSEIMAFEDFFEEDSEALQGVRAEMIENAQLERVFPAPSRV